MNKHEFIAWLRSRLSDVPPQELDRVAGFYASAIDERVEDGMDEAEAIHALGEPEALLQEIRSTLPESYRTEPRPAAAQPAKKPHKSMLIAACVLIAVGITGGILAVGSLLLRRPVSISSAVLTTSNAAIPDMEDSADSIITRDSVSVGTCSWPKAQVSRLSVWLSAQSLFLQSSDDGMFYVSLPEDGSVEAFLQEDGTLQVQSVEDRAVRESTSVTIFLPKGTALDAYCGAGNVELFGLTLSSAQVTCDAGNIYLTETTVKDSLSAYAGCGNISLARLLAGGPIDLICDVGSIDGWLEGSMSDYAIRCSVSLGQSSLPEHTEGRIPLNLSVDVGSVEVSFES